MKKIWKHIPSRVWLIVTAAVVVLILAVYIAAVHVPLLYGTLKLVLGDDRFEAVGESHDIYRADHDTKEASLKAANELNAKIVEEGIILLENNDDALPLDMTSEKRVSVFGKNSVNLVYGGSGSGKKDTSKVTDLYQSLTSAGFEYNPTLKSFYDDNSKSGEGRPSSPAMSTYPSGFPIGETPLSSYNADVKASYKTDYRGAAIVVISRIGGEGYDLPRTMRQSSSGTFVDSQGWAGSTVIPGAKSIDSHYLQLDQNETDLLTEVCSTFDKVVLVINCSTSMELGFLKDGSFPNLKAALWVGNPGGQGASAIGKVLSGAANPSGRTVDTYAADFTLDPTWNNFGNNLSYKGNQYKVNSKPTEAYFVRYAESIYVGYRYYETRGHAETIGAYGDPNWYADNVVYPLGYGLSYTKFSWQVTDFTPQADITASDTISVTVRVTNNGTRAGKDVVQMYYSPQYYEGGIEKSHVVFADFAKTDTIEAGGYDDVTLKLNAADMASYDWDDKNGNEFCGYELEAGKYDILISRNAHEAVETISYNVASDVLIEKDSATDTKIENLFDDVSNHIKDEDQYMSRTDFAGTMPQMADAVYMNRKTTFISPFKDPTNIKESDDKNKPWYVADMPKTGVASGLKLSDMIGKEYDDEKGEWDKLVQQLTVSEMAKLIGLGAFKTQFIGSIGKPETKDWDGPGGFVVGSFMQIGGASVETCFFASECVIAATYNKELAYKMGIEVGNEGIIGAMEGNLQRTFSGWYAPAVNIHRSPFSGRNFEYYSEDGVLSGKMAAEVIKGAKEKGVYTYLKHFALNDQETDRSSNGLATWADEQAMREIYFKPFEIAVKEGKTTAIMSSFNRIGTEWAGSSYNLLTRLLRDEWGFKGMVITDYNGPAYMNLDRMIRGGGDLNLFQSGAPRTDGDALTATQVSVMQKACKNILYTVANSNAMNMPDMNRLLPIWEIVMYIVFAAIILGLAAWGFFVIRKALKQQA